MKRGILTAGNFIVDSVKVIDAYPAEDMLAIIRGESRCNGGGPYNVLKDLAAMGADYPLAAAGLIGRDEAGDWIREDCAAHGIDTSLLVSTDAASTSYTDVMTNRGNGRRTFFHQPGANAYFDGEPIDFEKVGARIFHLGYLMLLDRLDGFAADGRTRAAHLLERASAAGLITSVDVVSTEHPEFQRIACSALPQVDFLVINELEAARILGQPVDSLADAAAGLLELGVRQAVVIHTERGAVAAERGGASFSQGSVRVPDEMIRGANGAGDAFAAGFLHGLHEGHPMVDRLKLGVCAAAACLSDPTPSDGLRSIDECLAIGNACGFRDCFGADGG